MRFGILAVFAMGSEGGTYRHGSLGAVIQGFYLPQFVVWSDPEC